MDEVMVFLNSYICIGIGSYRHEMYSMEAYHEDLDLLFKFTELIIKQKRIWGGVKRR